MNMLSPEAMIFIAYVVVICAPPFLALQLLIVAIQGDRIAKIPAALGGLTLLLWVPLIIISPQVLIDTFYPAL